MTNERGSGAIVGKKLRKISQRELAVALDDEEDPWWLGNRVLYELCKEYPGHTDQRQIIAKVWLIGRAYSASVERGRSINRTDSSGLTGFYEKVAKALGDSELDNRLAEVREREGFSEETLPAIISTHASLVQALKAVNSRQKRSFASKYLHFHEPTVFPIYDSIAVASLGNFVPPQRERRFTKLDGDTDYRRFAVRVLAFKNRIEHEFGRELTPRQLDRLLWGKGARA